MKQLSPIEFERLDSHLCIAIGYHIRLTKRSHDGGVDIFAKRATDTGEDSIIVQCKHYPGNTVSAAQVRELYGVLASRQDIARAVLITSGRFSADALSFSKGKNMRLIDGTELLGLLVKYNVNVDAGPKSN
ncbi:MAG: restriction endonuclease [Chloroflexi bacterium]|nr:restriction endonuclease [Chloroflexota bacterium]